MYSRDICDDQARQGPALANSLDTLDTSLLLDSGIASRILSIAGVSVVVKVCILVKRVRRPVVGGKASIGPHAFPHLCAATMRQSSQILQQRRKLEVSFRDVLSPPGGMVT